MRNDIKTTNLIDHLRFFFRDSAFLIALHYGIIEYDFIELMSSVVTID